jgi:hypothetical protein
MNELTTNQQRGMAQQTQNHAVALAAAVLDKRIATAKNWPRSVSVFKEQATELLQSDVETAMSAEYSKPVGGGSVRGPSVRLAELSALCWGNLEVEFADPVINETSVTVQAMAWDLERNIRMPGIATTSILNKQGVRYPQHLIETTISATASKARRNAILAVIPRAYINDLLDAAKLVASKNQKPLEQVRADMVEFFARSYKVEKNALLDYLGVKGVDDISKDNIDELRAVVTAIKEGEPVETYFGKQRSKAEIVKEKIDARKSKPEPAPETAPEPQGMTAMEQFEAEMSAAKTQEDVEEIRGRYLEGASDTDAKRIKEIALLRHKELDKK